MNANSANLEVFNLAKKILTDEYNNKRSNEFLNWRNGYENAWKNKTVILPFPPFVSNPAFTPFCPSISAPTDNDIIAKAIELINNANIKYNPISGVSDDNVNTTVDSSVDSPGDIPAPITPSVELPTDIIPRGNELPRDIRDPEPVVNDKSSRGETDPIVGCTTNTTYIEKQSVESTSTRFEVMQPIREIFQNITTSTVIEAKVAQIPELVTPIVKMSQIDELLTKPAQPIEELAKVNPPGRILPSIIKRLQDISGKRVP